MVSLCRLQLSNFQCTHMQAAAERNMLFCIGLYADPLYFGDYPAEVRRRVPHLQRFTPAERDALVNSTDFYAMNHYAARRASRLHLLLLVLVHSIVPTSTVLGRNLPVLG